MRVTITTLRTPPVDWNLEIEVEKSMTVAKLKELLSEKAGGPIITRKTRILKKSAVGQMYTLNDTEPVSRYMLVMDPSQAVPDAESPREEKQEAAPQETQPEPEKEQPQQWREIESHFPVGETHTGMIMLLTKQRTQGIQGRLRSLRASEGDLRKVPQDRIPLVQHLMHWSPEDLDGPLRAKMLRRLGPQWPEHHADPMSVALPRSVVELLREQRQVLNPFLEGEIPDLTALISNVFQGGDEPLKVQNYGLPLLHEAIFTMTSNVFRVMRPLLHRFGFEDSVAGLARMDSHIRKYAEHPEIVNHITTNMYLMCFGQGKMAERSVYERTISHAIWSGVLGHQLNWISTYTSYIQHIGLPPLARRLRSIPRTMAFAGMLLHDVLRNVVRANKHLSAGEKDRGGDDQRKIYWIVNASDNIEGRLAREGYFDDAHGFTDEHDLTIYIIGDELQGPWPRGKNVKVHGVKPQDFMTLPKPGLLFLFNTGIGTGQREVLRHWIPVLILATTMGFPANPVIVLTCRSQAEARIERVILDMLCVRYALPALSVENRQHIRNLYSGMAGSPDVDYDENGWLVAFTQCEAPEVSLITWSTNPDTFIEELYARLEKEEKAKTSGTETEAAKPGDDAKANPEESPSVEEKRSRKPAVFFGILDIKFQADKDFTQRVKVLETGDGRTSRFSGYGAPILWKLQQDYKLEDTIRRDVLTENKKLTHDTIVESGYAHLRPRQGVFRMEHTPSIAAEIRADLELGDDAICVLKLCNRARGAGVIPVRARDLDSALGDLLRPPGDIEAWLGEQPPAWARTVQWGCFEEQVRHWWSNECPVFLVEEYCENLDVNIGDKHYDGTMRVGFTLHREDRDRLPPGWVQSPEGPVFIGSATSSGNHDPDKLKTKLPKPWDDARPFLDIFRPRSMTLRAEWLGGYWKLPIEDKESTNLRERIVSVAKQGTCPVDAFHLHEVYASLGDMVALLFNAPDMSHTSISKKYAELPELGAFLSSRLACSMRMRDKQKSQMILQLAKSSVSKFSGTPKDLVNSYIDRNLGVHAALQSNWRHAGEFFRKSLEAMPANATARFLIGLAHLEAGENKQAIEAMERALLLDPDFKAPYANIGVAWLREGEYEKAAEVCEAGLIRHPYTWQALYNLGVAKFSLACLEERTAQKEATKEDRVVGAYGRYKTVYQRVIIRSGPSTQARAVGVLNRGDTLQGTPCDIDGVEWLRLDACECRELHCTVDAAWVLIHGACVGLGSLLSPDTEKWVEVTVRDGYKDSGAGADVRLEVPASATMLQVKAALQRKLTWERQPDTLQLARSRTHSAECKDRDKLGVSRELFAYGVDLIAAKRRVHSAAKKDRDRGDDDRPAADRQHSQSPLAPGEAGLQLSKLRARAREALESAKDTRAKDCSWGQRDEDMVAGLRDTSRWLSWSPADLPRDGWRIYGWRP